MFLVFFACFFFSCLSISFVSSVAAYFCFSIVSFVLLFLHADLVLLSLFVPLPTESCEGLSFYFKVAVLCLCFSLTFLTRLRGSRVLFFFLCFLLLSFVFVFGLVVTNILFFLSAPFSLLSFFFGVVFSLF